MTDGCVVRQRKAYPVYDEGYKANVEAIRAELAEKFPTLHLVGRNGMHKYNNQDHAMMTAMLTRREHRRRRTVYDVWNVNEDAEYHEAGEAGAQAALDSVRQVPRRVPRRRADGGPCRPQHRTAPPMRRVSKRRLRGSHGPDRRHRLSVVPQLSRYSLASALALALDFAVYLTLTTSE